MGDLRIISVEDLQNGDSINQAQLKELYQDITSGLDELGYRKDKELLNRAKELFSENGMMFEVAHMIKEIGVSYYREGNIAKAIRYVEDAVEILQNGSFEQDIQETLVSYITNIGIGYYQLLNYSSSFEAFQKCRHLIDNKISYNALFRYYHQYGIASMHVNKYERAIQLLERALQYSANDIIKKASIYNEMGLCFWKMKKYKDSYNYYKKALDVYKVKNDNDGLAMIYNNLSILYDTMKDTQKATESIEKCFELFDKTSPEKHLIYLDTYVRVALRKNNFSEAVDRLLDFIELSKKLAIEKRYLIEPIELIVDKLSKYQNEEYGIKLKKVIIDLINEVEDIEDKNKHYEERLYSSLGMLKYLFYSQARKKKVRE